MMVWHGARLACVAAVCARQARRTEAFAEVSLDELTAAAVRGQDIQLPEYVRTSRTNIVPSVHCRGFASESRLNP